MLYPTAGSRLYIADTPSERGGVIGGTWVEIAEVEAMGRLGIDWETIEAVALGHEAAEVITYKSHERPMPMQIILGNNPADAGQVILWKAAKSPMYFPFRLVFSDGGYSREWLALVRTLMEAFDGANAVMKLEAELIPDTVNRSEA